MEEEVTPDGILLRVKEFGILDNAESAGI